MTTAPSVQSALGRSGRQPLLEGTDPFKYSWSPIILAEHESQFVSGTVSTGHPLYNPFAENSYKNSCYYMHPQTGQEYMFVDDMVHGGTTILRKRVGTRFPVVWEKFMTCNPGFVMEWNPAPVWARSVNKYADPNEVYYFSCNTKAGGANPGVGGYEFVVNTTGDTTNESTEVTLASVTDVKLGATITGAGISAGTTIVSLDGLVATLSAAATATATGVSLVITSWWGWFMRVYRHTVNLMTQEAYDYTHIPTQEDDYGILDPFMLFLNGWWYMFYVRLKGDPEDPTTDWNPKYAVSRNMSKFYGAFGLGIASAEITDPITEETNYIDEAVKVVVTQDRKLLYTHSYGDSGMGGMCDIGYLTQDAEGDSPDSLEGVFSLKATPKYVLQSNRSCLCTALDITQWPRVFGSFLYSGECKAAHSGGRDYFFIAELD